MTDDEPVDEFSDPPTATDEVIHVCHVGEDAGFMGEIRQCRCGDLWIRRGAGPFGRWTHMTWRDRWLNRRKLASMGYI